MAADDGPEHRRSQVEETGKSHRIRRSRRASAHGLLVAIDAPSVASEPWVVDAIDISSRGLGLVLPPELLAGTEVLLSFRLDDHELSRLPATVQYNKGVSGGVRFDAWPLEDRAKLLEYLVRFYETSESSRGSARDD
ncbi:MAG: PilZ domain-containing protein [Acidobacteriota bacterium]